MLGLDRFKLDGNLLARYNVSSEIDITKGTRSDFPADAVLVTDAKILGRLY